MARLYVRILQLAYYKGNPMMKTHTYLIIGFHNYKRFVVDEADKLLLIGIMLNFLHM